MESWSIEVDKEAFTFSAAHFLIFPDGSAERLHGHNYRVYAQVHGPLSRHGLVLDFKRIKPLVKEIVDRLDEHLLVPGRHEELRVEPRAGGLTEVLYRDRRYVVPSADVVVLPVTNTSAENLAGWIGGELAARLRGCFPAVAIERLEVAVEEAPGQRAVFRSQLDPAR